MRKAAWNDLLPATAAVRIYFDGVLLEAHLLHAERRGELRISLPALDEDPRDLTLRAGERLELREPGGDWLPLGHRCLRLEHGAVAVEVEPGATTSAVEAVTRGRGRAAALALVSPFLAIFALLPLAAIFFAVLSLLAPRRAVAPSPALDAREGRRILRWLADYRPHEPPRVELVAPRVRAARKPRALRTIATSTDASAASEASAAAATAAHVMEAATANATQRATAITTGLAFAGDALAALDEPIVSAEAVAVLDDLRAAADVAQLDPTAPMMRSRSGGGRPAGGASSGERGGASGDASGAATAGDSAGTSEGANDAEGAVGLGDIGTLGHGGGDGEGTGYGNGSGGLEELYGGGSCGGTSRCTIGVRRAEAWGQLDKEVVRRVVRAHLNEVRGCYERELERDAHLYGRIGVSFRIDETGAVSAVAADPESLAAQGRAGAAVTSCVTQAVARWTFPRVPHSRTLVHYPFWFETATD